MRYINAQEIAHLAMYYESKGEKEKAIKYEEEYEELQREMNRD